MTRNFNKPDRKKVRQSLRNEAPKAEQLIWQKLKGKRLGGHKFRRQHGIGSYIVDFYCSESKLVIEIDGDSHFKDDEPANDAIRTAYLEERGLRVIRFTNNDVYKNMDNVLMAILKVVEES